MKDVTGQPVEIGEKYFSMHKIRGTVTSIETVFNGKGEVIPVAKGVQLDGSPWESRYPSKELPPVEYPPVRKSRRKG